MFEKFKNLKTKNNTPNEWDTVADVPFDKEQTEQNAGERETDVVSVAKQHRQIWDKIVDRYQENKNRYSEIEDEHQSLGLDSNEYYDNEDKLSDALRSKHEKYDEEYDNLESLEHSFDFINDKMSERLADHVLKSVDGNKITELFGLDPRYVNNVYHDYDKSLQYVDTALNSSEAFGLFCVAIAKDPLEDLKGKTPKEIIQVLENSKRYYEVGKETQKSSIASVLQRVSYNKETNAKITDWLDKNVPDHEKVEGEALLEIINEEYNNIESEEEIFSSLFE